jgi:hypothetical protein
LPCKGTECNPEDEEAGEADAGADVVTPKIEEDPAAPPLLDDPNADFCRAPLSKDDEVVGSALFPVVEADDSGPLMVPNVPLENDVAVEPVPCEMPFESFFGPMSDAALEAALLL